MKCTIKIPFIPQACNGVNNNNPQTACLGFKIRLFLLHACLTAGENQPLADGHAHYLSQAH